MCFFCFIHSEKCEKIFELNLELVEVDKKIHKCYNQDVIFYIIQRSGYRAAG